MDKKHKGSRSELLAAAWLLEQVYEVFRNVSQHGPADFIIWDPNANRIVLLDVKTIGGHRNEILVRPRKHQSFGIDIVTVSPEGECNFVTATEDFERAGYKVEAARGGIPLPVTEDASGDIPPSGTSRTCQRTGPPSGPPRDPIDDAS